MDELTPPVTPKRKHLTRDMRLRIRSLYFDSKWTQPAIAGYLKISENQVQYTCQPEGPTPRRRSGRPPLLSKPEVELLIEFVCSLKEARQLPWSALAAAVGLTCSEQMRRQCWLDDLSNLPVMNYTRSGLGLLHSLRQRPSLARLSYIWLSQHPTRTERPTYARFCHLNAIKFFRKEIYHSMLLHLKFF